MRSYLRASLCALLVLLGTAAQAQAITVVNLGDFIPNALNNHRQIVGDSVDPANDDAPSHAEMWTAGVLTRLREPANATVSDAYAINASGRIVGDAQVSSPLGDHAIYWDGPTDAPHQIGPLSPRRRRRLQRGHRRRHGGRVVGYTLAANYTQFGLPAHGGRRAHARRRRRPRRRDDDRRGHHARRRAHPRARQAPPSTAARRPAGTSGRAPAASGTKLDITPFPNGSQILGCGDRPAVQQRPGQRRHGARLQGRLGRPDLLPAAPERVRDAGQRADRPQRVNAKHTVVGTILGTYMGQPIPHAAIWKPDGTVVDLKSLLPANSDYILGDALAINDNGDIVGIGGQISTQKEVGFLLPAGYVVDSIGDEADKTPGDGDCLTAQGTCTLRAALQEVNAGKVASPTAIDFALPGGNGTIAPDVGAARGAVPDRDRRRRARSCCNGSDAGAGTSGLVLQGDESTVRGMEIDNFKGAGVRVEASDVSVGALPTDTPPCAFPCNTFKSNAGASRSPAASGAEPGRRATG